ncbi:MAG: glycosyltransferase [Alphaproteobacteria bacterium]|nr:glycosyltransferase [Alphaproteobacteria bacterium]
MPSALPTLSVIIPVHNVEKFLPKCLDSILAQKGVNIDVVLVDNNSTDDSLKLCAKYASKFSSRYPVKIHTTSEVIQGPSAARNTGLDYARRLKNDYTTFVDSDDYIGYIDNSDKVDANYYKKIIDAMKTAKVDAGRVDGVCMRGKFQRSPSKNPRVSTYGSDWDPYKEYYWGPVWSYVFKSKLVYDNDIRFNEDLFYGEDLLFNAHLLPAAKKVVNVPQVMYFYRDNADSLVATKAALRQERSNKSHDISHKEMNKLIRRLRAGEWPPKPKPNFLFGIINLLKPKSCLPVRRRQR